MQGYKVLSLSVLLIASVPSYGTVSCNIQTREDGSEIHFCSFSAQDLIDARGDLSALFYQGKPITKRSEIGTKPFLYFDYAGPAPKYYDHLAMKWSASKEGVSTDNHEPAKLTDLPKLYIRSGSVSCTPYRIATGNCRLENGQAQIVTPGTGESFATTSTNMQTLFTNEILPLEPEIDKAFYNTATVKTAMKSFKNFALSFKKNPEDQTTEQDFLSNKLKFIVVKPLR